MRIQQDTQQAAAPERRATDDQPSVQTSPPLSKELSRRHAGAVELGHIFVGENLFAIDVILEPELNEERDEKADKPWNQGPWKWVVCGGSDH
ncbi:MAG: hypothetical protein ACJ8NS_04790 [Chthoniobacterales bacterium]